ncbi:MAG TPA: phosphotransferase family protein [Stellaceae bacterium]|nr:phosphotransferase family protein [Stellaceae bacterium]
MSSAARNSATPLDRIRARFLRRIVDDIDAFIRPGLRSGDAAERAAFAGLVLSRLAADGDRAPAALARMKDQFAAEIARSAALLGDQDPVPADEVPGAAAEQVFALRTILAGLLRRLSSAGGDAAIQERLEAIFALEARWHAALSAAPADVRPVRDAPPSVYLRVTPESVTDYLRRRFPQTPEITAVSVEILPGGRSKKTIFISIDGADRLPARVVMRQDTGMTHMGTAVVEEVPILRALAESGLPIPEILHVEAIETVLGPPFLLMRRLPGAPTGDFTAFAGVDPEFVAGAASALARLHAIDPRTAGFADAAGELRRRVDAAWRQWRDNAIEPSPLIDFAFHWVSERCDEPYRRQAIVHGDYRPHNLLAADGQLSGVLDWEFAHLGDPAEDLAYFRPTVTPVMPWPEFMGHYETAGGRACDEETLHFYDVWGVLRLAALGAGAVRGFLDGATEDFTQGAGGYFVIPMFERRLIELLQPITQQGAEA